MKHLLISVLLFVGAPAAYADHPTVNATFEDVPTVEALKVLANIAGLNLIRAECETDRINATFEEVAAGQAFQSIVKASSCFVSVEARA